jgi:molybdopterin-guanine dinucleotide biosynthesis protein A
MSSAPKPHGLLLTGGTSRRMGADKAGRPVGGVPMAARAGRALMEAASPVLAVGPDPGLGLDSVRDGGCGPLGGLAAGMRRLADDGFRGPVLLVACDMPFLTPKVLTQLAGELARTVGAQAAVPVAGGRLQPLAACYAASVLPVAERLVGRGELSMRALLDGIEVHGVRGDAWAQELTDVDTPADLQAANAFLDKTR